MEHISIFNNLTPDLPGQVSREGNVFVYLRQTQGVPLKKK